VTKWKIPFLIVLFSPDVIEPMVICRPQAPSLAAIVEEAMVQCKTDPAPPEMNSSEPEQD
jgi:hypothetical protein